MLVIHVVYEFMVFSATFNDISAISWRLVIQCLTPISKISRVVNIGGQCYLWRKSMVPIENHQTIEHKKDHYIWHWKFMSWLRTGTQMW